MTLPRSSSPPTPRDALDPDEAAAFLTIRQLIATSGKRRFTTDAEWVKADADLYTAIESAVLAAREPNR